MLKCRINPEFNIYNTEQMFDKNINFKIFLWGGGVHFFNALNSNNDNGIKVYNE